jgi:hypothetical protein
MEGYVQTKLQAQTHYRLIDEKKQKPSKLECDFCVCFSPHLIYSLRPIASVCLRIFKSQWNLCLTIFIDKVIGIYNIK